MLKTWEKLPESDFSNASLAKKLPQQSQTWADAEYKDEKQATVKSYCPRCRVGSHSEAECFASLIKQANNKRKNFKSPGGNRSRGVGLVCSVSLDFEDLEVKRDFHGRLIIVKLSLHDWQLQIMCIYAPNDPRGRSEFFSDLQRHAFPGISLFLGGDFNCIESLELDRAGW